MTRHMLSLTDVTARLRTSGRRAFAVMRRRDWLLVVAACAGVLLLFTTLLVAQLDAYRARSQATEQAQAQASIVADQRAAQSHRIDSLSRALASTREQVAKQSRTIGRQEQAIRDLAAQVDELGGRPVARSVSGYGGGYGSDSGTARPTTAPTSQTARAHTAQSSQSSQSAQSPKPSTTSPAQPQPTSTPPHDDGPLGICALLPLC